MMGEQLPFDQFAQEYDEWFTDHQLIFMSELNAVRVFIPRTGKGVDIGSGTGRFVLPLHVAHAIDPSFPALKIAKSRGISVVSAVAEALPFRSSSFDYAVMVTSICFFYDAKQALIEARRVLTYSGNLIIGFIDRDSFLGKLYERKRFTSRFYRHAHFYTANELISILRATGFGYFEYKQTIFDLAEAEYPVLDGFGKGGFVVVNTRKTGTKKRAALFEIHRPG